MKKKDFLICVDGIFVVQCGDACDVWLDTYTDVQFVLIKDGRVYTGIANIGAWPV